MSDTDQIGRCPRCEAGITGGWVLIAYETPHADSRVYAECPDCHYVAHPTSDE